MVSYPTIAERQRHSGRSELCCHRVLVHNPYGLLGRHQCHYISGDTKETGKSRGMEAFQGMLAERVFDVNIAVDHRNPLNTSFSVIP